MSNPKNFECGMIVWFFDGKLPQLVRIVHAHYLQRIWTVTEAALPSEEWTALEYHLYHQDDTAGLIRAISQHCITLMGEVSAIADRSRV